MSYVSHVRRTDANVVEMTLLIMLRETGELSIVEDRHRCGLFASAEWEAMMRNAGLEVVGSGDGGGGREVEDELPFRPFVGTAPR